MKVFVADHDAETLDLITKTLRREGYSVSKAADGQEALQRWKLEKPDLVLLDTNLPRISGLEVCRQMREETDVPIIMLTEQNDEAGGLRAVQLGADGFFTHPFSLRALAARIQALLRRYKMEPVSRARMELRVGDITMDVRSHNDEKR